MADNASSYPTLEQAAADFKEFQKAVKAGASLTDQSWEPLIDSNIKKDYIRAWRQFDKPSGQYCYKVYGIFTDVKLEDFFKFYTDYVYRDDWDQYTSDLHEVTDPIDGVPAGAKVLYWRVKFGLPLISDREYLFTRQVEKQDSAYFIFDKNLSTDKVPESKKVVRVGTYNSYIILQQDGDNVIMFNAYVTPLDLKMPLPGWLINWAASTGVKNVVTAYRDSFEKYPAYLAKAKAKK